MSAPIASPALLGGFQLSLRAAAAAGLAVWIAQLLQLQYPLYALIAAVLVTDLSPPQSRLLAWRRLAGTVLGAASGAALIQLLPPGPLSIGLSILAVMFASHLLRLEAAAKLAGYVCGIVMLDFSAEPWTYALHRLIETLVGIAMGVLVSFVPKLLRVETPAAGD
jgi:uncharacterized membrane protein YgaE (UPF0421/DUF939 family)